MSDESEESVEMPATNVAQAYAADMARLGRTGPIGLSDDGWLVLAHALQRCGTTSADEWDQTILPASDALAACAVSAGFSAESPAMRAARALRGIADPLQLGEAGLDPVSELVVATQAVAEEQELAGLYSLAYAMLHALLGGFATAMRPRVRGNLLAQIGRAARQFGAVEVARDAYEEALQVGYEAEVLDVVARALLGKAVLALTRGNFPSARDNFERALANADRVNDPELIRSAHHGLLNCSFASGDLDSALVHGWNVLRLCIAPDSRAEALLNMAEICRLTGEHDAAMRVFAVAMEWTSQRRVRLHALSGAIQSAIAINRHSDARRYLEELDELMPRVPDAFTQATIGVEVADSLHRLGDEAEAEQRLSEAVTVASEHGFHEIVHRAEQIASNWQRVAMPVEPERRDSRRRRAPRSDHFRMVLRSLKGLTAAAL